MNLWKEIATYQGCTDFDQLQFYLDLIYKYEPNIIDFQTQHPIYLVKMIHLHQLALQYYDHSSYQLNEYEHFIEKTQIETNQNIQHYEKILIQNKTKIKALKQKLNIELKQRNIFIEKITKTQLIQCLYCDKIVTTDSQFNLHMQKYHRGEFNKKEVNIINQAIQNQLLTQQMTNKIQQQNQQTLLALNYQLLQQTKTQLANETKDFLENTMNVDSKFQALDTEYNKKIQDLESQIIDKLTLLKENAQKEEQIREEQLNEKTALFEKQIQQEFEKSKNYMFQNFKLRSNVKLKTTNSRIFNYNEEEIGNSSDILNTNRQIRRGQTIQSLKNIDDGHIFHSQGLQLDYTPINENSVKQNEQTNKNISTLNDQIIEQDKVEQKRKSKKQNDTEENKQNQQIDESNIDYQMQNIRRYQNQVDQTQKYLMEILFDKSKGSRREFSALQREHYVNILENNIAQIIKEINKETTLKGLKQRYRQLTQENNSSYNQLQTKISIKPENITSTKKVLSTDQQITQSKKNIKSKRRTSIKNKQEMSSFNKLP